jgi:hypothetical protein
MVGLVIYRLYFHPLSKFPGPKYAAISHWHEAYYDVFLQGQFTFKVQEMHKQYGRFTGLDRGKIVTRCGFPDGENRAHRAHRAGRATYPGL